MDDNSKLIFWRPADGNGRLVFGDADDATAVPDAVFSADADLPGLEASGPLRYATRLSADADLSGLDVAGALQWDANVARPLAARTRAPAEQAAPAQQPHASTMRDADGAAAPLRDRVQQAAPVRAPRTARWQAGGSLRAALRTRTQQAAPQRAPNASAFETAARLRGALRARHQQAAPTRAPAGIRFEDTLHLRAALRSPAQPAAPLRQPVTDAAGLARFIRSLLRTSRYQQAMRPLPGPYGQEPPIEPPHLCYDPARLGLLVFEQPYTGDGKLLFVCHHAGGEEPPPPATIVVPIRRVYIVINEIELIRVDGSHPLPAYTLALSLDADSWTWQWSATLHKAALPLLAPAQAGAPVEVQATINGTPYRLLVESVRRAREFASTRIEVSGRGLAALLDAPYAPQMSFGNAAQVNAEQLMGQILTLNGVGFGWDVDFDLADWLVPAGVFAHQGTWIGAINAIAQAAGGYVQPHATARTLRVLHRYPQAPWDWGAVTPDIELPQAPVQVEGVEWIAKPDYNRVFLTGEAASALYDVKRAGTAGDIEAAPVVVDPLLVATEAATQRGRAILSDTGPQAMVTLTLQVLPETGLILPGTFVRRTDGAEVLQGLVRSTALAWDAPRMRQTIEVQTHG